MQNVEYVTPVERRSVPGFIEKGLRPGEEVLGVFKMDSLDHPARKHAAGHNNFALTTERLIHWKSKLIGQDSGEIPYSTITGIKQSKGMLKGKVSLQTGFTTMTRDGLRKSDVDFVHNIIAGTLAGRHYRATPPA